MLADNKSIKQPLITVYMPTHNRRVLLERAVNSVFAQTYQNFELIIVDDASKDDTPEYLKVLAEKESRVTVLRNDISQGACVARNRAIKIARGKFVTGLDDDDEFLPHRLASLLDGYNEKYAFVNHGFIWHFGKRHQTEYNKIKVITLAEQLNANYATNQVFVETKRMLAIGGFDESFKACQDYDTFTRLIIAFGDAKCLGDASYIVHQGHEGPRITAVGNHTIGFKQFYDKHQHLMSKTNKINQRWLMLVAMRTKPSLKEFLIQIQHGFVKRKSRYYLSKLFSPLDVVRRKWLKGS
jgi:glycosyltransferase involved in cell wall biosynthesis